jgi:hypothetical protein
VQDTKRDELELILQVLDGMNNLNFDDNIESKGFPEYTWKGPEEGMCDLPICRTRVSFLLSRMLINSCTQVATDFLSKVFEVVSQKVTRFGGTVMSELPVDIVITVPVVSLMSPVKISDC